jgi:DNA-binding transcriptional MerR regulator
MKFWLKIIALLIILILVSLWAKPALADDTNTQTNTSGSNTNITGGYDSTSTTTNNNDGQTNTTTSTTTNATTSNGSSIPPPSANSPSYSSMSQDVCSMGVSGSITTGIVGISGGKHFTDENCERIKLAKVLQDFGMKVASVAVLCQDARVHAAMQSAGTPCPFNGKIGKEAQEMWDKYPELRPDYDLYLAKQEIISKVDAELLAQQLKEAEEEAERKAAELAKAAEEEALKQARLLEEANEEINDISVVIDTVPVNRSN